LWIKTAILSLDQNELYSGCYGRVSITFYAFNSNGNKGIAAGLGNIQKLEDGEAFRRAEAARQQTLLLKLMKIS